MSQGTQLLPHPKHCLRMKSEGAEQRITMHEVTWNTFEHLLKELGDNRGSRLAYDRGELEIMAPYYLHERMKVILSHLIYALVEALDMKFMGLGSTTCKRPDRSRGLEPDCCFYLKNEPLIREFMRRHRREPDCDLDLSKVPPPDLIVEIDLNPASLYKMPIYEALEVPEVWRHDGNELHIHCFKRGKYEACATSPTFGAFPLKRDIARFIDRSFEVDDTQLMREMRAWVKKKRLEGVKFEQG